MRIAALLPVPLLACLFAASAAAVQIQPDPISFEGAGILGEVDLLETVAGLPAGAVVLEGTVDPSDTTLVFQGRLLPGSAYAVGFGVSFGPDPWALDQRPIAGIGWIPGPDLDIGLSAIFEPGEAGFGVVLFGGQVADRFFVSYAAGDVPVPGDVALAGSTQDVSQPFPAVGTAVVVPEPEGLGLLLAAAACGVVRAGGGRRRVTAQASTSPFSSTSKVRCRRKPTFE